MKYDVEVIFGDVTTSIPNVTEVVRVGKDQSVDHVVTSNLEEGKVVYVRGDADILIVQAQSES